MTHQEPQEHQPIRLDAAYAGGNQTILAVYDAAHCLTLYIAKLYTDSVVNPTSMLPYRCNVFSCVCTPLIPSGSFSPWQVRVRRRGDLRLPVLGLLRTHTFSCNL